MLTVFQNGKLVRNLKSIYLISMQTLQVSLLMQLQLKYLSQNRITLTLEK